MAWQVKWRPRALEDIERLQDFLHPKNTVAAKQAAFAIFQAAKRLQTSPGIGRPMPEGDGRRELIIPFGTGAYVVRYFVGTDNTVVVVRVWHSREDR